MLTKEPVRKVQGHIHPMRHTSCCVGFIMTRRDHTIETMRGFKGMSKPLICEEGIHRPKLEHLRVLKGHIGGSHHTIHDNGSRRSEGSKGSFSIDRLDLANGAPLSRFKQQPVSLLQVGCRHGTALLTNKHHVIRRDLQRTFAIFHIRVDPKKVCRKRLVIMSKAVDLFKCWRLVVAGSRRISGQDSISDSQVTHRNVAPVLGRDRRISRKTNPKARAPCGSRRH
mmetsp:Transcript_17998/g.41628  ORF Transcript_17998/g.41628 Transcript_17998/m.41628 type:complete len:225 (-) Transcript_17998:986-1660(-)